MRPTGPCRALLLSATLLAAPAAAGGSVVLAQTPDEKPAAPGPAATFPTFVHDFGEVGRGDRLTHSFVVRNEGDAPLEITSVHPT